MQSPKTITLLLVPLSVTMQLSLKAVIAAAAFIVSVNALPTPTSGQGVARRSYPSGGLTCYCGFILFTLRPNFKRFAPSSSAAR